MDLLPFLVRFSEFGLHDVSWLGYRRVQPLRFVTIVVWHNVFHRSDDHEAVFVVLDRIFRLLLGSDR